MLRTRRMLLLLIVFMIGVTAFSTVFIHLTNAVRTSVASEKYVDLQLSVDQISDIAASLQERCKEQQDLPRQLVTGFIQSLDMVPYTFAMVYSEGVTALTEMVTEYRNTFRPLEYAELTRAAAIQERGTLQFSFEEEPGKFIPAYVYFRWINLKSGAEDERLLIVAAITSNAIQRDLFADLTSSAVALIIVAVGMSAALAMVTIALGISGDFVKRQTKCVYCGRMTDSAYDT